MMNYFIVVLVFFFALISCEEQNKNDLKKPQEIIPIDPNAPKELSVADVEALMKEGGTTPSFQYQGVLGYGESKEYVFNCDSGKTIQFELSSQEDNVIVDVQKEIWTNARLDAEKVARIKSFVHISDSLSFVETCKKNYRFKTILKLNPDFSDTSSIGNYQLKTYIQ